MTHCIQSNVSPDEFLGRPTNMANISHWLANLQTFTKFELETINKGRVAVLFSSFLFKIMRLFQLICEEILLDIRVRFIRIMKGGG